MTVIVDSSVWIAHFKRRNDHLVELLEADLSGDEGESRIEDARRLLGEMRKSAMRVHAVVEDLRRTRSTADAVDVLSVAPVDDAAPNAAPRVAPKAAVAHVLVVDDDALVASAVKRSLREHDVVVQGSARDALELFERGQRFDIVLCDLMMPDVTGMDLYDAVSKIDPAQAARMVFVTGGAVTARAREFVATTENQVLDKPFDVRKLREIIARNLK